MASFPAALPLSAAAAVALQVATIPPDEMISFEASQAFYGIASAENRQIPANVIAQRAAAFASAQFARPRNKRLARAMGCSERTAERLRAGHGWTRRRIAQAIKLWDDFHEVVFKLPDVNARLERFEAEMRELKRQANERGGADQT